MAAVLGEHRYKEQTIKVVRGDYAPLLKRVVDNLQKAKVRMPEPEGTVISQSVLSGNGLVCRDVSLCSVIQYVKRTVSKRFSFMSGQRNRQSNEKLVTVIT